MIETDAINFISVVFLVDNSEEELIPAILASGCAAEGYSLQEINVSGFLVGYGYFLTQNS